MARRRQTGKVQDLPFRIDRNLKTALTDQVADGLRSRRSPGVAASSP